MLSGAPTVDVARTGGGGVRLRDRDRYGNCDERRVISDRDPSSQSPLPDPTPTTTV